MLHSKIASARADSLGSLPGLRVVGMSLTVYRGTIELISTTEAWPNDGIVAGPQTSTAALTCRSL